MAAAAAAGLAGLLLAEPSLEIAMKAAGSIYLVWLAWKIGRSGPPHLRTGLANPIRFLGGVWMLWHNPKGWAMTIGAAASFAGLANGPLRLAALLGLAFGVAAAVSLLIWCMAGRALARLLRTDRQWQMLNAVLGVLLIGSILPIWL